MYTIIMLYYQEFSLTCYYCIQLYHFCQLVIYHVEVSKPIEYLVNPSDDLVQMVSPRYPMQTNQYILTSNPKRAILL